MSVPSMGSDDDDDDETSMMVHDSSDTTVATQTSASWHSVVSDVPLHTNLFVRSSTLNAWLKLCAIEPDIRLTTAQEWKLRACLRRFLSLSNLPLRLQATLDQESPVDGHPLQQLALYLHVPSLTDPHREALEVKLFEFTPTATPVLGVQSPRFVFHMASNCLTLNVRSAHALLALCFATRDHEPVRGTYYRWRDHEHARFDLTVDIDLSLLHQFAAARD